MTRALILAAGRGSRMGSKTANQPKCFTLLHGLRLLDWQLAALRGAGINDIAIVRGYCADKFSEPVTYFDNLRWAETNMVQSLATASSWLESSDCIISYSDIFYTADTVRHLCENKETLAISYDPNWLALWKKRFSNPLLDAETFRRHADGTLAEIGSRSDCVDVIEGQYMGLLKLTPASWSNIASLLEQLGSTADKLDMTSLLRLGLERGWRIATVPVDGVWGEVDSMSDLEAYSEILSDNAAN